MNDENEGQYSRPVFDGLFNFSGRRNRLSYFLSTLLLLAAALIAVISMVFWEEVGLYFLSSLTAIAWIGFAIWVGLSIITQRLKDIGLSPWWIIGILIAYAIPIVNIIVALALHIVDGTEGDNEFGVDPRNVRPRATGVGTHRHRNLNTNTLDTNLESERRTESISPQETDNQENMVALKEKIQSGLRDAHNTFKGGNTTNNADTGMLDANEASEDDSDLYWDAYKELRTDSRDHKLWIKCLTLASGDKAKAQYLYIKSRVDSIKNS